MADKPILMSAPMVRACLDGSKTQTRRIVKNRIYTNGFHFDGREILCHCDELPPATLMMEVSRGKQKYTTSNLEGWENECPYGQIGDLLWVRESGALLRWAYDHDPHTGTDRWRDEGWIHGADEALIQREQSDPPLAEWVGDCARRPRPSIHMPRWASRLTLEIAEIRVERLNDCSEADAIAEGAKQFVDPPHDMQWWTHGTLASHPNALPSYRHLWETINGLGSWDENPWVWVISFNAHHKNIDQFKKERS